MRFGLFLPHVGVFGGVRRYLELGNAWRRMGHEVTLFHPDGTPPGWLEFHGATAPLATARGMASEVAICGDPHTYGAFREHRADLHLYYCVLLRDPGLARAIADREVLLAANSTALRSWVARRGRRPVLDGVGGIDADRFRPDPARRAESPVRILVNGRRSRPKKGTDLILAALRGLPRDPDFEVVLFDTQGPGSTEDPRTGVALPEFARYILGPTQQELVALYQSAHVFIAAERKAGWCNTALEAMACGCAVACTSSGTEDFARDGETAVRIPFRHPFFVRRAAARLLRDRTLRARLSAAGPAEARRWNWNDLALKLVAQLERPRGPGA